MKEKIYNFIRRLGNVVAIFLMFSPIIIIREFETISEPYFLLICSILYDFYMYSILIKANYFNDVKDHYFKHIKNIDDTLPDLKLSDKDKLKSIQVFIEDLFKNLEK